MEKGTGFSRVANLPELIRTFTQLLAHFPVQILRFGTVYEQQ